MKGGTRSLESSSNDKLLNLFEPTMTSQAELSLGLGKGAPHARCQPICGGAGSKDDIAERYTMAIGIRDHGNFCFLVGFISSLVVSVFH